jgi:hypothetical protein
MRDSNKERDLLIMIADRCTRSEAERFYKAGSTVYENPKEWIINLKSCDCYEGQTLEDVKAGKIEGVSFVNYNDHDYLIEYVY